MDKHEQMQNFPMPTPNCNNKINENADDANVNENESTTTSMSKKAPHSLSRSLPLDKIIQSLNSPINEEQTWALIYQLISCIQIIHKNQTSDIYLVTKMNHISITEDGTIVNETFLGQGQGHAEGCRIKSSNESTIISNIGLVMFMALDYGLSKNEEREISTELERLLDSMTSAEDDEALINFEKILEICTEHCAKVSPGNENPEAFYTQILKSYAQDGIQLTKFLRVVLSSSESEGIPMSESSNEVRNCKWRAELRLLSLTPELNKWANSWKHVVNTIKEDKIQLKKVTEDKLLPKYEPTPYENLLNQIKNGRFKLKKAVQNSCPIKIKHPHDEIMDYIRSRPRLRNVTERVLAPLPKQSLTPIEQVLESIKQEHKLIPVGQGQGIPKYKLKKKSNSENNE